MTALEKAARALAYSLAVADDFDEDEALVLAETDWPEWVGPARAVLMAVREPSIEDMMDVQDRVVEEHGVSLSVFSVKQSFTAMIDAILNEEPK